MDLPDYKLLSFIGRGGYGDVWLARDREGEHWAVKIVYRSSFDDDRPYEREYKGILRFLPISKQSEAQMRVVHVGRRDDIGCFYYIMELADDESGAEAIEPVTYQPHTLRSELKKRQRVPATEVSSIAWGLAGALEKLHVNGVVHRDIKPGNIIFVGGRPKLADVGLVTEADQTRTYAGTEGYIPPEGPGTYRADIYSLGMTLYEACTGCDRRDFPALPENVAELPDHEDFLRLIRIINRACQPDRRKRYQSAGELRSELEALMRGRDPTAGRKRRVAVGTLVLAAIASAAYFGWPRGERSKDGGETRQVTPVMATSPAPDAGDSEKRGTNAPEELVGETPAEARSPSNAEHPPPNHNSGVLTQFVVLPPFNRAVRMPTAPKPLVMPNLYERDAVVAEQRFREARTELDQLTAMRTALGHRLARERKRSAKNALAGELRTAEAAWHRQKKVVEGLRRKYESAAKTRDLMMRPQR